MPDDNFDMFETDDAELEALMADLEDPDVFEWTEPACWTLDEDFDE